MNVMMSNSPFKLGNFFFLMYSIKNSSAIDHVTEQPYVRFWQNILISVLKEIYEKQAFQRSRNILMKKFLRKMNLQECFIYTNTMDKSKIKKELTNRHPGSKPESQDRYPLRRWHSILPKVWRFARSYTKHQKLLLQCFLRDQGNNKKHW